MNSSHDDRDPVAALAGLRGLTVPVQDPARVARTQAQARALLRAAPAAGLGAVLARLYFRAEPVLVSSIVVVYLGWAVDTVMTLLG